MEDTTQPTIIEPPLFKWSECDPRDAPPSRYLVDGLIPILGCHLIIGAPKAGKSQLTAHIVACLLSGRPVFGHYEVTEKDMRVLWLLLEETRYKVRYRIEANLRGLGIDDSGIKALSKNLDERLIVSARDKEPSRDTRDMIFSVDRHAEWVLKAASEGEYQAIVLDSLRPAHGYEENSSTDMKPVTDFMRELSEYTCGLILHHRGHSNPDFVRAGGDAGRGTSDLDAARDTALHIQKGTFGGAMLIGVHHRDDSERFVVVQTTPDRATDTFTWERIGETEDPGIGLNLLNETKLFLIIDAASSPEDLPSLSAMKSIFGFDYKTYISSMERGGRIESRKLATGKPGQKPTLIMRPGQFNDDDWAEAEKRGAGSQ